MQIRGHLARKHLLSVVEAAQEQERERKHEASLLELQNERNMPTVQRVRQKSGLTKCGSAYISSHVVIYFALSPPPLLVVGSAGHASVLQVLYGDDRSG